MNRSALLLSLLAVGIPSSAVQAQEPLTLAEAAAAALRTHPTIAGAAARTDAAQAGLDQAQARRLPGLQLDASLTHFQEPMIVAPLHRFDPTDPPRFDETLVQGRLGAAYTLVDGGVRGARIKGAGAGVVVAERMREAAEMELLSRVATTYASLSTASTVRDAAQAQFYALEAEQTRANQRVETGAAARVELLRASAALEDARAQMAAARSQVDLARRSLALLMGVPPESIEIRPISPVTTRPTTQPQYTASPQDRPTQTPPHIAAAARAVDAAEAAVSAERATRLPRLDAGAALLDFGTPTGEHVLEWQAGLQLSWPVFTGGARSASLRRAEAALAEPRADPDAARLDARRAEDVARSAITEADARADALMAALTQWIEVARIEALALENGAGVQSDLLRAHASLFQATAGLARARSDAVVARVELARAQGALTLDRINEQLESR